MTFFCISNPNQTESIALLEKACQELQITFQLVTPQEFQPSGKYMPKPGDLVYRVSDSFHPGVMEIEYFYLSFPVTTFYQQNNPLLVNLEESDSFLLPLKGIAVPKTFFFLPENRAAMDQAVADLGGYPIIIKALGGSHGVGIMKIESQQSLYSVSDFLRKTQKRFVLKEFIKVTESARLIVLGDQVIDSIKYIAPEADFRSNEGHVPNVKKEQFSHEIQDLAIQAVHALGLEFGGVDILFSGDKKYVAEVNFPCYFPRAEELTGTPIAKQMIAFLMKKSQS